MRKNSEVRLLMLTGAGRLRVLGVTTVHGNQLGVKESWSEGVEEKL